MHLPAMVSLVVEEMHEGRAELLLDIRRIADQAIADRSVEIGGPERPDMGRVVILGLARRT